MRRSEVSKLFLELDEALRGLTVVGGNGGNEGDGAAELFAEDDIGFFTSCNDNSLRRPVALPIPLDPPCSPIFLTGAGRRTAADNEDDEGACVDVDVVEPVEEEEEEGTISERGLAINDGVLPTPPYRRASLSLGCRGVPGVLRVLVRLVELLVPTRVASALLRLAADWMKSAANGGPRCVLHSAMILDTVETSGRWSGLRCQVLIIRSHTFA